MLTLNGFVTNDQKNQLIHSRQCILKFYNTEMVIKGKISSITPEKNPRDLTELNKFSGDILGSLQVINLDETVLKKIITNYIR